MVLSGKLARTRGRNRTGCWLGRVCGVVGSFDSHDWRAAEAAEAAEAEVEAAKAEAALLETSSVPLIDTTAEWLGRAR